MFDKPQASHTLGLELDGSVVRGVALAYARGKPVFASALSFSAEQPPVEAADVKPLYKESDKTQLAALADKHLVVSLLPPQDVLIRPLELKLKKESDIDAVLTFQTEPMLPFPIENALVDKLVIAQDKEGSKLSVAAVRKDHLQQHLDAWDLLAVQPEVVTAAPAALALFAKFFSPAEDLHFVFHAGLSYSLCILVQRGKLLAAQTIAQGVNTLSAALAKDLGSSLEAAQLNLRDFTPETPPQASETPHLAAAIDAFRMDLARTLYALAKQAKGQEVPSLLLTGEGCALPWLAQALCSAANRTLLQPREPAGFFSNGAALTVPQLQTAALPIGAALCALPKCPDQINFRQQEFSYPDPWKRLKTPVLVYLALCLGIAAALVILGKASSSYQEAELKQEYLDLLRAINKPYAEFESEIAKKSIPPRELAPNEVPDIATMSPQEISTRLNYLEKDVQATPQTFPLQPNVPLVSDVLAWITSHPNVTGIPTEENPSPPSLKIENFSYTMVKRPEQSKKQEKYQVKVELEFSSPTPKMAREFHDALIAPNDIVDPKGEIKWNSGKDRYRTSFYLKDRTSYTNL